MKVLRSLVAVAVGIGFLMLAAFVGSGLSTLVGMTFVGLLGAFMAGWATARLATYSPMGHALVLALIVGAAALSQITRTAATGWYPPAAALVGVLAILGGGWIRAAAAHARGTVEGRT